MICGVRFSFNCLLCLLLQQSFQIGAKACAYRCGDGSCIDQSEICNGEENCEDGSDETREVCADRPCRNALGLAEFLAEESFGLGDEGMSVVSSFRCGYGGCISFNFKCNGIKNCADASDETAETCKDTICDSKSFRCDYGACISRISVCDHVKNCHDGSDERSENCKFRARRVVCPKRSKKTCDNRLECYDLRKGCDGKSDCADGSDEKADLCNPRPPKPSPTTAPATPPTVVFPVSGGPSLDCPPPNCHCPFPGLEHFCLPCGEIADINATCLSLYKGAVCSLKNQTTVSVDILSCGAQLYSMTSLFSRNARYCFDEQKMVPALTLVHVDCWGIASAVMRCHSDGFWRASGAQVSRRDDFDTEQPMRQLCQPYFVNSPVCGRRSRHVGKSRDVRSGWPVLKNRWPMVMALMEVKGTTLQHVCKATLVNPLFLVTAAHCVTASPESKNQSIDVRRLRVQVNARSFVWVSEIIIHPDYEPEPELLNDIALIKLENPLLFNSERYPACVDLGGNEFLRTRNAVTFNRSIDDNYGYTELLQHIDPGCFSRSSTCNRLQIAANQFCGVDVEKQHHLMKGSSGGPYLLNFESDDAEEWTVAGVVSSSTHKHDCQQQFTVFTAVSAYETWVTNFLNNEIK